MSTTLYDKYKAYYINVCQRAITDHKISVHSRADIFV